MAAENRKNGNVLYIGLCSSYSQYFAADFDIIKYRRPIGIEMRSTFGILMYVNQCGGRETGISYNFGPVAGRNVISSANTMFSGVASQCNIECPIISSKSL